MTNEDRKDWIRLTRWLPCRVQVDKARWVMVDHNLVDILTSLRKRNIAHDIRQRSSRVFSGGKAIGKQIAVFIPWTYSDEFGLSNTQYDEGESDG
jgi:hypothetical protein